MGDKTVRQGGASFVLIGILLSAMSFGAITPKGFKAYIGKLVPDFQARGIDGKTYRLSQYRGKVILLVFWSPW